MRNFFVSFGAISVVTALGAKYPPYESIGRVVDTVFSNWPWFVVAVICAFIVAVLEDR
jgi:hypothetical protein